jgi:hypothetical protein
MTPSSIESKYGQILAFELHYYIITKISFTKPKKLMYQALVQSILLYGAETWDTKHTTGEQITGN